MKAMILVVLMVLGIGNVYPQDDSYFKLLDDYFKENNIRHSKHDENLNILYNLVINLTERVEELEVEKYNINYSTDTGTFEEILRQLRGTEEKEVNEILEPDNK